MSVSLANRRTVFALLGELCPSRPIRRNCASIDHVIPRSAGGSDELATLAAVAGTAERLKVVDKCSVVQHVRQR